MSDALQSLAYSTDPDPMPTLFFDADWETVKAYFQREVPRIVKELLGLR